MAFGIDLGTTNSSIAWADDSGTVYSLRVSRGREPFGSVLRSVVFDPLGRAEVGEAVLTARAQRDGVLVSSFKAALDEQRLRERRALVERVTTADYDAVQQGPRVVERIVYEEDGGPYSRGEVVAAAAALLDRLLRADIVEQAARPPSPGPTAAVAAPVGGTTAVGRLLGRLRRGRGERAAGPLTSSGSAPGHDSLALLRGGAAVRDERMYIGVPTAFGPTARKRLLAALAGTGAFGNAPDCYRTILDTCRFVYEPLAIAAGLTVLESQTVLIVDYGGGTLDLALLDYEVDDTLTPRITERALGGMASAGDRLDALFREALLDGDPGLRRVYDRLSRSSSPFDRAAADGAFTLAKIELSRTTTAPLVLEGFVGEVERAEFERAVAPAMADMVQAVEECLRRGGRAPSDVSQVVLTGGSSLAPVVQDRLRSLFPHLDDTAFVAQSAGVKASEEEALTGISRGLARFGFLQTFESAAPCNYELRSPLDGTFTVSVQRGASDVYDLAATTGTKMRCRDDDRFSVALYSDLVRRAFNGALVDVPLPAGTRTVDVVVASRRDRFAPAFEVRSNGTRLATFDLDACSAAELADYVELDREWLPSRTRQPRCGVLTRPLRVGDLICWHEGRSIWGGEIRRIRHIASGEDVREMRGFELSAYVFYIARQQDGRILLANRIDRVFEPWQVWLA